MLNSRWGWAAGRSHPQTWRDQRVAQQFASPHRSWSKARHQLWHARGLGVGREGEFEVEAREERTGGEQ